MAPSAFRSVLDAWLFTLEDDAIAADPALSTASSSDLAAAADELLDRRLAEVSAKTPASAQALRGYRAAVAAGDAAVADGLAAWLGGQPHVGASAKRGAGIRGDLDHFGALGFLQGLLLILRDAGHPGLLVVLDEVETLQRMRSDVRGQALNALRQLMDEVDSGRFPGLYLVLTGTPAFFTGPSGVPRLAALAQRLATDFGTDSRFDNPRAVQIRLAGFDREALEALGIKVRDLHLLGADAPDRIRQLVDDPWPTTRHGGCSSEPLPPGVLLSKRALTKLDELREEYSPRVLEGSTVLVREPNRRLRWWTWAGARANAVLVAGLLDVAPELLDESRAYNNSQIGLRGDTTSPALAER